MFLTENSKMKHTVLDDMNSLLAKLNQKLRILSALDSDTSTSEAGDLHDQIVGMEEAINLFEGPMRRATQINNPRMKETANA
jgi:hypothetical protein